MAVSMETETKKEASELPSNRFALELEFGKLKFTFDFARRCDAN